MRLSLHKPLAVVAAALLLAGSAACSTGPTGAVPTPQDLADALLTAGDVPPGAGFDEGPLPISIAPVRGVGVVGEDAPGDVAFSTAVCDTAGQDIVDEEPAWQAHTRFLGEVPGLEGEPARAVTLAENLYAGELPAVEEAFGTLRDALGACLVPTRTQQVGGVSQTESVEMRDSPSLGDASFTVLSRLYAEYEGEARACPTCSTSAAHVNLWLVVFRKGNVLGAVLVSEAVHGVEQAVAEPEIADIANAAVAKLP